MKSKKKVESITETIAGLWIGTCIGGWLCEVIEGNDTLAKLFLVAALAGMAVCFVITAVIDAKWKKEQKDSLSGMSRNSTCLNSVGL